MYYKRVSEIHKKNFFQKENAELNGDSFHDPDDPFGENADHDKLLAIAKQFEAKYVSFNNLAYRSRSQINQYNCQFLMMLFRHPYLIT